jgi:transmembrane protein 33
MALTWFLSRLTPLALLPFVVYSVFHVATYIRGNIIPVISPAPTAGPSATSPPPSSGRPAPAPRPTGPVADAIGKFIKEYYDSSMTLVAFLEIALWLRVAFSALLFARGSWILLVAYTVFLRARYAQSSFVQSAFANLGARADAILANQSTDPRVRSAWEHVKGALRTVVDSTDVQRVAAARAQAEQAKKAQ